MKLITDNRRGMHGYKILDKYECGMVLQGWEVKSARANTVNLQNSYCFFRKGELFLYNALFKSYMLEKNDETRERKLLMHKKELIRLNSKLDKLGNGTIIPTKLYFTPTSKIKIEIALVVGMSKSDKREEIKAKDNELYLKKIKQYY
ncbi:SsrA-binding protein [Mycoplasmopsis columbina]|uniref:SsrA-binding protein n=1 Tax=Mycoplasmopsis columbina SF7 TaxID=1037410 RepID=F9UKI4_9BACT|nr:SsrA-binding protein [Mycoplasmopsis columbina]EGV00189.1 SsrA-binding protein [Mycoplasmopsis columbina SF7]VEU77081.1 SsrA RNA (tmRNA)-binding protein [Mycoplasmopsis columbina]